MNSSVRQHDGRDWCPEEGEGDVPGLIVISKNPAIQEGKERMHNAKGNAWTMAKGSRPDRLRHAVEGGRPFNLMISHKPWYNIAAIVTHLYRAYDDSRDISRDTTVLIVLLTPFDKIRDVALDESDQGAEGTRAAAIAFSAKTSLGMLQ